MKYAKYALGLGLCLMLFACSSSLPEERPADMAFHYYRYGGLYPLAEEWVVGPEGNHYRYQVGGDWEAQVAYGPAPVLDSLWQLLRDNGLSRIVQEVDSPATGVGSKLELSFGDEHYEVLEIGDAYVRSPYVKQAAKIFAGIQSLLAPLRDSLSFDYVLEAAGDSLPAGLQVEGPQGPVAELPEEGRALPGEYQLTLRVPQPNGRMRDEVQTLKLGADSAHLQILLDSGAVHIQKKPSHE